MRPDAFSEDPDEPEPDELDESEEPEPDDPEVLGDDVGDASAGEDVGLGADAERALHLFVLLLLDNADPVPAVTAEGARLCRWRRCITSWLSLWIEA